MTDKLHPRAVFPPSPLEGTPKFLQEGRVLTGPDPDYRTAAEMVGSMTRPRMFPIVPVEVSLDAGRTWHYATTRYVQAVFDELTHRFGTTAVNFGIGQLEAGNAWPQSDLVAVRFRPARTLPAATSVDLAAGNDVGRIG